MKTFTIHDMISFGTYLLSEERNKKVCKTEEEHDLLTKQGISPKSSMHLPKEKAGILHFADWQEWKKNEKTAL